MNFNNNNNALANNSGADAFVAALLQQQQQQPPLAGRGRVQQTLLPQAGATANGLMDSGAIQARQTVGRGRGASRLQQGQQLQQQQAPFGTQQNGALGGSLGLGQQQQQPASGRGRSTAGRGRTARQQQQPVGTRAIPLAQQFALENAASAQGADQQALATLFGTAPTNGAASLQRQQTAPRRTRASSAAANGLDGANFPLTNGAVFNNNNQQQQTASRRVRSANGGAASTNTLGSNNNNAFGAADNAASAFGLGASPFAIPFQNQSQNQQQVASRRARSVGVANDGAFGSNAPNGPTRRNNNNNDGGANNNADSDKIKYILVDGEGNRLGSEYRSKSAYGAAGKAARSLAGKDGRNHSDIYLWDPNHPVSEGGRVYSYAGRMEPITNPTPHTQKYGITMTPKVQSRGYVDLGPDFKPIRPQQGTRSAF
ncbi:hypothetical protein psal_cds_346 [Pandoravirus salinus]|uniref:Uncharacterized protein n=1 Tax=Pandoravirus salinus TaxID=1349410 RepID=S4VUI2_9VIRU|nr:hypothetical protein psal_cds_346 [Pandoravirus salinus]AGO83988.1 hypothetical protein psal_cds_346 [Pandoravirus salinus]